MKISEKSLKSMSFLSSLKIMLLVVFIMVISLFLYFNLNTLQIKFTFYSFKKNGWKFIAKDVSHCVFSAYDPKTKLAHIQKGFYVENVEEKRRITLCQEEQTDNIIVFFDNVLPEKMHLFCIYFKPDVIFVINGDNVIKSSGENIHPGPK